MSSTTATANPQPIVPHYGNGNPQYQYYNNYGLSPSQAPPHPDRSYAAGVTSTASKFDPYYETAHPPTNIAFNSPPPPSLTEIHTEFTASSHHTTAPEVDLLNDSTLAAKIPTATRLTEQEMMDQDYQFALRLAAQLEAEDAAVRAKAQSKSNGNYQVSSEVMASQSRALTDAKRRNHEQAYHTVAAMGSYGDTEYGSITSTALTVPMNIPSSHNPTGSDAVHPSRPQWKQTRGTKTAAGATTGAIIGGVAFGPAFPIGMVLGGAAGGYAANKISKTGERRAQRKWEQNNFQKGTQQSLAVSHDAPLV